MKRHQQFFKLPAQAQDLPRPADIQCVAISSEYSYSPVATTN